MIHFFPGLLCGGEYQYHSGRDRVAFMRYLLPQVAQLPWDHVYAIKQCTSADQNSQWGPHCTCFKRFYFRLVWLFRLEGHSCIRGTHPPVWFPLKGTGIVHSKAAPPSEIGGSQEICFKSAFLIQINHERSCTQGTEWVGLKKGGHSPPSPCRLVFLESVWQGKSVAHDTDPSE